MTVRGRYSPVDPVAYGAPVMCPNEATGVISALTGTNAELVESASRLWIAPGDRVVDVTYGNGVFWRNLPEIKVEGTDLAVDGVDCRALPYENASVDVLVFDPPYQPTHGSQRLGVGRSYRLGETGLNSVNDVLDLYEQGLREAARVVRTGGRILVKTQDMTYNHRLHLIHLDVLRRMVAAGFDLADMFVLVNTSRLVHQSRRQHRSHRAHSYLLVGVRS